MTKYYCDYVWKKGLPYGILESKNMEGQTFKIVSDPYHKKNSIEVYIDGSFLKIIYDSSLFDFRELKLGEQLSWQKNVIHETELEVVSHIRNQDDRLILIEKYEFESGICRICKAYSPHGIHISTQKIYHTKFNDPCNAAILFDANDHPVMQKKYKLDEKTEEFKELLEELWDGNLIVQPAYST